MYARWFGAAVAVGLVALLAAALIIGVSGGGIPSFGMMGSRGGMGMMGPAPSGTVAAGSAAERYQANCAVCHGADRRGLAGPALLPSTLTRDDGFYIDTITNGRPGTAMPAWGTLGLSADQIRALVS